MTSEGLIFCISCGMGMNEEQVTWGDHDVPFCANCADRLLDKHKDEASDAYREMVEDGKEQ